MLTHSLSTLEFDKICSLLARHTSFAVGRELALGLTPSSDPEQVERLQQLTVEAARLRELRPNDGLGGARDVAPLARRAVQGAVLTPGELLEVQATARVAGRWLNSLAKLDEQLPTLAELRFGLSDHRVLDEAISAAIDESGQVMDSASPALQRLRTELRTTQERIASRLRQIVTSPTQREYLQEAIVTQRNGRHVVPVKAEYRAQFKGIVHDQSASGATLFMEPLALVELGNRHRQLQVDEAREVERVLRSLSATVGQQAEALARSVETLGELDLHLAKARLAEAMDATRPVLFGFEQHRRGEPVLRLLDARHPLLSGQVVPISIELGANFDVVLITGPNTGGKTVALKTIGLLALMAQAGLQLPAGPGSRLAVFQAIMADIGDEQSIEQSLSTFSSHITRVVEMLRHASPRSLMLLDELGAGTDPLEGAALARAIVEYLLAARAFCVATTHYSELKAFAAATPRVENASVEFDLETLSPTYRLSVGLPGRSNALAIATRLGMPQQVTDAAERYLHPEHGQLEGLLADVQRQQAAAEADRARAADAVEEQERLRGRLREALAETERERRAARQRAVEESEALLSELRREVRRVRERLAVALRQAEALRHSQAEGGAAQEPENLAREVEEIALQAEALTAMRPAAHATAEPGELAGAATPLEVGAEVMVPSLGVLGTVLAVEENEAELEVRGRRVRLPRDQLIGAVPGPASPTKSRESWSWTRDAALETREVALQIDLRGKRRDEASQELDTYLHDAYVAGMRTVRVIHGRGSGAVRQAVQEMLTSHPLVDEFSFADRREGGDGATVVRLAE